MAAAPAAAPDAELALPSPACSEAETEAFTPTDTGVPVERRTYTPSDEELREGIMLLREETPGMGMGKMRKAFQSRRQWAARSDAAPERDGLLVTGGYDQLVEKYRRVLTAPQSCLSWYLKFHCEIRFRLGAFPTRPVALVLEFWKPPGGP